MSELQSYDFHLILEKMTAETALRFQMQIIDHAEFLGFEITIGHKVYDSTLGDLEKALQDIIKIVVSQDEKIGEVFHKRPEHMDKIVDIAYKAIQGKSDLGIEKAGESE